MTPQEEGRLLKTVEDLVAEVRTMSGKLQTIEQRLSYGKGALAVVIAIAGAAGALLTAFIPVVWSK